MNDRDAAEATTGGRSFEALSPLASWQSVSADMQAIFRSGSPAPGRPRSPLAPKAWATRSRARRLALPIALLTCVAGTTAGFVVVAPLRQPHAARPASPIAIPPVALAAAQPPTAMSVTLTPEAERLSTAPSSSRRDAQDVANRAPRLPQAQPDVTTTTVGEAGEAGADCAGEDGGAACSRVEVIAADRALRFAYLRAIDAGVDRGRLVAIRNRWARLRASDYGQPDDLLADYAELADRLDRATQFAEGDLR